MSQKMVDTIMGYVPLMVGLIIALIAIKIILVIISHILKRDKRMDPMVYKFIYNSVKVILLVILLIAVLAKLGVPTSSMVAVVSVGGAAVAIALRDTLSDILGGLTIIISKPFKQGDLVVIDAHTGFVMNIELLATTLKSFTNELIRIPNGVVTKSVVVNRSHGDKHRMDINVTVSYDTNIAKAREVMIARIIVKLLFIILEKYSIFFVYESTVFLPLLYCIGGASTYLLGQLCTHFFRPLCTLMTYP